MKLFLRYFLLTVMLLVMMYFSLILGILQFPGRIFDMLIAH
jgi:hypothetical protein